MKRITALILALTLLLTLLPTVFAVEGNTYSYVLKSSAMGGSTTMPFSLADNIHTYDRTVETVSSKWQFEGVTSSASAATTANFTLWTKYVAANTAPTLGSMALALSVYVPENGTYAPSLSYIPQVASPKAEIYLVPKPDGFSFLNGDGTENYKVSSYAESMTADDRIGIVDMYGASATETTAALSKRTLTAGYYLLLIVPNGANEKYAPEVSGARVYVALRPTAFTLDSTAETAIDFTLDSTALDVGDSAQASAAVTRASGKRASGLANITFTSSAPDVASVNANGTVTALSEGKASITATVTGTSVKKSINIEVAGTDPGNNEVTLSYILNSSPLILNSGTVIRDTALYDEYSEIDSKKSALWAYVTDNCNSRLMRKNDMIISYNPSVQSFYALKLKITNFGVYELSLRVSAEPICGKANVYIIPYNGGAVTRDTFESATKIGTLDAYSATVMSKEISIGNVDIAKRGDYLLVLDMIEKNPSASLSGGYSYIYPQGATLTAVPPEADKFDTLEISVDNIGEGSPMPLDTVKPVVHVLRDSKGIALQNPDFAAEYESTNEDVVSVDDKGMLTAKSCGEATIKATVTCDGETRTDTCNVTVDIKGANLMAEKNPGFENDEWYWSLPREDTAPATPEFMRIMVGKQATEKNPENRALGIVMNPEVAAISNPDSLMLKTDGSRVRIKAGNFYRISFKLKLDYTIPQGGSDMQFLLDTYGYINKTGLAAADLAGDTLRNVAAQLADDYHDKYDGKWNEYVLPICAPVDPVSGDNPYVYISPRIAIRPVAGDLARAGYDGTIWIDDIEICEVGYSGVDVEVTGNMDSLKEPLSVIARPYTTMGEYMSLNSTCVPTCVSFKTSDSFIVAEPKNTLLSQTAKNDGLYYAAAESKLGGKLGTAEVSASMTLSGITREGKTEVTPGNIPMVLLYANATAENPTLVSGEATKLSVIGTMSDGTSADLTKARFSYKTSDKSVATVTQDGTVKAGRAGSADITVAVNLDGTIVETIAQITVTDDSSLTAVTLLGSERVGYLRDEKLTLTGKMSSGFDANMSLASVEYIVEADPVGAVTVSADGKVFGATIGGTAKIFARATMNGGHAIDSNTISITVTESDPRDIIVNFETVDVTAIPKPKDAVLAYDGWQLNTSLSGKKGMDSIFIKQGIEMAGVESDKDIAFDINIPYSGAYTLITEGYLTAYGAISEVYLDGEYAGEYSFYYEYDNSGFGVALRSFELSAGTHTVLFRAAKKAERGYFQYPAVIRFRGLATTPEIKEIRTAKEVPALVVGDSATLDVSLLLTDGLTVVPHKTLAGKDDTSTSITYKSSNSAIATVDAAGNIKGIANGDAVITITATANGNTKTRDIPVTVDGSAADVASLNTDRRMFYAGERVVLGITAMLESGTELSADKMNIAWSSDNTSVAEFSGNTLIAKAPGSATIKGVATYFGGTAEVTAEITVEPDSFGIVNVTAPTLLMRPNSAGITLSVSATTHLGNAIDLTSAQIAFGSGDESIATVDGNGHVTPVALGETTVSASVTLGGKTVVGEANVTVRNGKVSRTYYTDEISANAQENVRKYAWAQSAQKAAIAAAEKYVGKDEKLWKMVTAEGLPRSMQVGRPFDPMTAYCRYCGENLQPKYSIHPFSYNPLAQPWKVQCPECRRVFPSNDFGSYYELGINEHGIFDKELAFKNNAARVEELGEDASYLRNVLYPEAEEKFGDKNWGVDDGFGYNTGRTYSNGVSEVYTFIACYNHWGLWYESGQNPGAIDNALKTLSNAYIYTGDAKYGRAGAILLDRVADVYPDFDLFQWRALCYNSHGGTNRGKVVGSGWEPFITQDFAKAYDAFFPMYDDPYVVSFLAEKAAKYKLANDKSTPEKIRENCENGILREIYKGICNYNIDSNFGMKQSSLALAAVVLDTQPETSEYIDFIFKTDTGGAAIGATCTGGSVNERLVDAVSRDGQGNESSPAYNRIWVTQLTGAANTLGGYDGYNGMALYDNPKFLKMIKSYAPMTLVRRGVAPIGDSGLAAGYTKLPDTISVLTDGFKYSGDIQIAQQLYWMNGNSTEGLRYDAFTKNPESIAEDVKKIIDTYGEYDFDRSDLLSGYGLSVLRGGSRYESVGVSGPIDTQRDFWMYFGGAISHCHEDGLNLGIDAFGIPFSSDLGYPEATGIDPNRIQWQNSTLAHNAIVVNNETQIPLKEASRARHFDNTDRVRIMDIDAPELYSEVDIYRRTVVMVDYDADNSYGLDFFHVKGGDDHLYSFHASSEEISSTSDNLEFVEQVGGTYAGASVPFGEDPYTETLRTKRLKYPTGYTWLENVRRADDPGVNEFFVDFNIKDFRNLLGGAKKDMHLRLTMLNDFNLDEVSLATGKPPRTSANMPYMKHLQYMLARRSGKSLNSLFTTVLEPYAGNRYITDLKQVSTSISEGIEKSGDFIKAVKVTLANGRTDYVVYATNNAVKYVIDGKFDFRGFVGVYSLNADGQNIYSYIQDGDTIGERTELDAALEGTVADFTRTLSFDNSITVRLDNEVAPEKLSDKVIFIENDGVQYASYTIKDAKMIDARTAKLNLGDVTLIRKYVNNTREELGYVYNIAKGQHFTIPLSYTEDEAPMFKPIGDKSVSAGSVITQTVQADGSGGSAIKYAARNLPRGASLDAETGEFSWKPDSSQVGENAVAIDAIDAEGRVSTVYFTLKVLGSTTGGDGGSGGGGTTEPTEPTDPTDPTEPTEPTKPVIPPATGEGFTDLGSYDWARDAINGLADDGIIKGVSKEIFAPGANITRADFAILLVRAFKLTSESTDNFADVSPSDYFATELAIAKNAGIIGGIGDNKYAPRKSITREDMMVIVYRALTKLGVAIKNADTITGFRDTSDVSDYALGAVATLIANDIIGGANGRINPKATATRAEVAVLLKRVLAVKQ